MAMAAAWAKTPCNMTALDSTENVDCLRNLSMDVLLEAQLSMKYSLAANNGVSQAEDMTMLKLRRN